jgi:MFS family permease
MYENSFRWFFSITLFTNSALWMQRVNQDWIALDISKSAIVLGVVTSLQFLPAFILSLQGGKIADRNNKAKVLVISNLSFSGIAVVSGFLIQNNRFTIELLLIVTTLFGLVSAVDGPVRLAYVTELNGTERIARGIGLNSLSFNFGRFVGPMIAGSIGALFGVHAIQYLVGFVYLCTAILVWVVRPVNYDFDTMQGRLEQVTVAEGVSKLREQAETKLVILYVFAVSLLSMHFPTYIAIMARLEFDLPIDKFSYVFSSIALGFGIGGILMSRVQGRISVARIFRSNQLFTFCAIVTGLAPTPTIFSLSLISTGIFGMLMVGSLNAYVQEASPDKFNGRFIGIYISVFTAGTTVGVLFVGLGAELINPRFPIIAGPCLTLLIGWWILTRTRLLKGLDSCQGTTDSK